jgi:hypothetical protein
MKAKNYEFEFGRIHSASHPEVVKLQFISTWLRCPFLPLHLILLFVHSESVIFLLQDLSLSVPQFIQLYIVLLPWLTHLNLSFFLHFYASLSFFLQLYWSLSFFLSFFHSFSLYFSVSLYGSHFSFTIYFGFFLCLCVTVIIIIIDLLPNILVGPTWDTFCSENWCMTDATTKNNCLSHCSSHIQL